MDAILIVVFSTSGFNQKGNLREMHIHATGSERSK
jgi:hypothetical protein